MIKFAFIIHPLKIEDFYLWKPYLRFVPNKLLKCILYFKAPFLYENINIKINNQQMTGHIIVCPLLPEQMVSLSEEKVLRKIKKATKKGENLGVEIIGLGGYTSVVGDKGFNIANSLLSASVTSGNSLTVAMVIKGCKQAARIKNINLSQSRIAIIGATGSIGSACTKILSGMCKEIYICGRDNNRLKALKKEIENNSQINIIYSTNVHDAIKDAEIVITTTSATTPILSSSEMKKNAIACDVSEPININHDSKRKDILYFKGGLVENNNLKIITNLKLKENVIYACLAETIILTAESIDGNFSIGENLKLINISRIGMLAEKYGMKPYLPTNDNLK